MTGKGDAPIFERRHVRVPFFGPELKDVYAAADLLIARAGLSTMTEAGVLGIPTILVPIPNSHQEGNARYFEKRGVAMVLAQSLSPEVFADKVLEILNNFEKRRTLSDKAKAFFPGDAARRLVSILKSCV